MRVVRTKISSIAFTEGVLSYSAPQGMVRGSMLELMDHTFDGQEESQTGDLRGGLGQLVDGRYGEDNFKAGGGSGSSGGGSKGFVKGYDWVGWRRGSAPSVNLVFSFDGVRSFERLDIHTNNHFTKDVQVFREAKVYFSNEEDKFGDDRYVGFKYMPDLALENARNVSIGLKGEHGRFVMVQLYFAAKWILISEVTFVSTPYAEKPFPVPAEVPDEPAYHVNEGVRRRQNGVGKRAKSEDLLLSPDDVQMHKTNAMAPPSNNGVSASDTAATDNRFPPPPSGPSESLGAIVGTLLTLIFVLIVGIGLVCYRYSRPNKNATPTHSLLNRKFIVSGGNGDDRPRFNIGGGNNHAATTEAPLNYTPYAATSTVNKMSSVYDRSTQETIYEDPSASAAVARKTSSCSPSGNNTPAGIYPSSGGFLSLNRKYSSSDPVLSEDCCTDDYAEPTTTHIVANMPGAAAAAMHSSNSFTTPGEENVYAVVGMTQRQQKQQVHQTPKSQAEQRQQQGRMKPVLQPLPISHYSRPLSPTHRQQEQRRHQQQQLYLQQQQQQQQRQQMRSRPYAVDRSSASLFGGSGANIRVSPPSYSTVMTRRASSSAVASRMQSPPSAAAAMQQQQQRLPVTSLMAFISPTSSVPPPHTTPSETATETGETEGGLSTGCATSTSRSSSNSTIMQDNNNGSGAVRDDDFFYAATDVCIPDSVDLARLYLELGTGKVATLPSVVSTVPSSRPDSRIGAAAAAACIDPMAVTLNEVARRQVEFVEKLGEGEFGEIHLCRMKDDHESSAGGKLVAVKSLRVGCTDSARADFETEARILTSLNDANLVSILGVCFSEGDPLSMICEYGEKGDLCQFLQDHVAETSLSKSPGVPTLRYAIILCLDI